MASSGSSSQSGGPLEWITGLSPNDARLIVAGLAVVAAGRVAWDLVVYGEHGRCITGLMGTRNGTYKVITVFGIVHRGLCEVWLSLRAPFLPDPCGMSATHIPNGHSVV
jgi:hypothetical protein